MIGIVLDSVLMLLLVAALAYGVRLEKKLTALRAGQLAFAGAVNELNAAAGRAENALVALRSSGEDADLLHDRIVKARALKTELETLMARMDRKGVAAVIRDDADILESRPSRSTFRAEPAAKRPEPAPMRAEPAPLRPELVAERPMARAPARAPIVAQPEPHETEDDDRARRMQALAERIQGMANPRAAEPGRNNVSAILGALQAERGNQTAQDRINRARRNLDDDLFAA